MKITLVLSKRSALTVGGTRGCPVVDICGFRRTLTMYSCLRGQRVPLSASLCLSGGCFGPSACDPLHSGCPRNGLRLPVDRLLICAVRSDSGMTYSVLFSCVNNMGIISRCVRSLKVGSISVATARSRVRRSVSSYCGG